MNAGSSVEVRVSRTASLWRRDIPQGFLVAAIDLILFSTIFSSDDGLQPETASGVLVAIALAQIPVLIMRRRFPVGALIVLAVFAVATSLGTTYRPFVFVLVAIVHWAEAHRTWRALGLAAAGFMPLNAAWIVNEKASQPPGRSTDGVWINVVLTSFHLLLVVIAYVIGRTELNHRLRLTSLEKQHQEAVRKEMERERLAMGRELHDIVSNAIAVMTTAAGAAARVDEAEQRDELLDVIQTTGAGAGEELQRLLRTMRNVDEPVDQAVSVGFTQDGDALVRRMNNADLEVELHEVGERRSLDRSVDIALYRTLQEALTNSLKHGDRSEPVAAQLTWGPSAVALSVVNPVDRPTQRWRKERVGGHGLAGIEERVAIVGGDFSAKRVGDGFAVDISLPVSEFVDLGADERLDGVRGL